MNPWNPPPPHPTHWRSPAAASMANAHPYPPFDPTPFRELATVVMNALERNDTRTSNRINAIEIAIGSLSKVTSDTRDLAQAARKDAKDAAHSNCQCEELKDSIESLTALVKKASTVSREKSEKLERLLGNPEANGKAPSSSVVGRIGELERAILELSETIGDPDAAHASVVKHEVAVGTDPLNRPADVGVDTVDLLAHLERLDSDKQVTRPSYVDAAVEARSESSTPLATSSVTLVSSSSRLGTPLCTTVSTFTNKPLAPASWTSTEDSSDRSSSPGISQNGRATANGMLVFVPNTTTIGHYPSSVLDEREILTALEDGMDASSQHASSPRIPSAPPTPRSPPRSPIALAHSMAPPISPQIPRRTGIFAQSGTSPRRIPTIPRTTGGVSPPRSAPPASASSSSLSSLSSPTLPPSEPFSPVSPPRPQLSLSVPARPVVARAASWSSMSSLSSLATSNTSSLPKTLKRQSDTQSVSHTGKASGSASAKVKIERKQGSSSARPAKRRKTTGTAEELLYDPDGLTPASARGNKTAKSASRGRSKSQGRGASSSAKGGKRKSKAVIVPLKEIVSVPPLEPLHPPEYARRSYEAPQIGTDCEWPPKIGSYESSHREFVQCDYCEGWYHFGCVGLLPGDPRLEADAEFVCPPCESSEEICEQRRNARFQAAACSRPDCDHPGGAEDTNEYFVERIIGRRLYQAEIDGALTQPTQFMWLVKWDGYKADQATWSANEHLGECSRIIEDFETAAEIEGHDLDASHKPILLNEARAGGWAEIRR